MAKVSCKWLVIVVISPESPGKGVSPRASPGSVGLQACLCETVLIRYVVWVDLAVGGTVPCLALLPWTGEKEAASCALACVY